jgi:hypothetical protein
MTKVYCWGKGLSAGPGLFRTFEDFEFRAGIFPFVVERACILVAVPKIYRIVPQNC